MGKWVEIRYLFTLKIPYNCMEDNELRLQFKRKNHRNNAICTDLNVIDAIHDDLLFYRVLHGLKRRLFRIISSIWCFMAIQ